MQNYHVGALFVFVGLFLIAASAQAAGDLVGYWKLDEGSGGNRP